MESSSTNLLSRGKEIEVCNRYDYFPSLHTHSVPDSETMTRYLRTSEKVCAITYLVPATCSVMIWLFSSGKSKAKPKSAILGSKFLSNKMLLAFLSRWMIRG